MKKLVAAFTAVLGLLAFSLPAQAEGTGIYVAPKFVYGLVQMDKQRGSLEAFDGETYSAKLGNDDDSVFGGALAIGYDFSRRFDVPVRAELEYGIFSTAEAKGSKSYSGSFFGGEWTDTYELKQKSQIQTLFLNAYYDIRTGTAFTPYVGGGLGFAFINSKVRGKLTEESTGDPTETYSKSGSSKLNTNFAWNVGAGVGWDITDYLTMDLGYRFAGLGKAKTKSVSHYDPDGDYVGFKSKVDNIYMHQVMLGLRFTF